MAPWGSDQEVLSQAAALYWLLILGAILATTLAVKLGRAKGDASPLPLKRKRSRRSVWMMRLSRRADSEGLVRAEGSTYIRREGGMQARGAPGGRGACLRGEAMGHGSPQRQRWGWKRVGLRSWIY